MKPRIPTEYQIGPDEVARRAHRLWLAAGRPLGQDFEFSLRAEAELRAVYHRKAQARASMRSPAKPGLTATGWNGHVIDGLAGNGTGLNLTIRLNGHGRPRSKRIRVRSRGAARCRHQRN